MKKVLHTLLFLLVMGLSFTWTTAAGQTPGLPGDHGLEGGQDAGGGSAAMVQQVLNLSAGWNWISCYVECDANLLATLQEGLAANNGTAMIKDMSYSTMLQNGSWSDTDLALSNTSMYMVNLEQATTVTLTAPLANPSDHPITLTSGWNWIGYPLDHSMTISEALSGLTPHTGDQIKSMTAASSYNGTSWEGTLEQLEPGGGYMYYNSGTAMTLVFPSSVYHFVLVTTMDTDVNATTYSNVEELVTNSNNTIHFNEIQSTTSMPDPYINSSIYDPVGAGKKIIVIAAPITYKDVYIWLNDNTPNLSNPNYSSADINTSNLVRVPEVGDESNAIPYSSNDSTKYRLFKYKSTARNGYAVNTIIIKN